MKTTQSRLSPRTLPLISVSIPVFNEEENIDRLYARLSALAEKMADRCTLEFVFTDNHSEDRTWPMLLAFAEKDERVRAIRFSKNFGFQRSILTNYLHTRGDAVMQIDADLQDPPELLERFFDLWCQGYAVVYGVRKKRKEGALISLIRRAGYWFIDKISEEKIPRDVGDFRLIDRKIVEALRRYNVKDPYLRGMIAALGFKQVGVPYEREARIAGKSKFPLNKLLKLGFDGVINQSMIPLKLASYAGVSFVAISIIGAIYYIILKLSNPDLPQGLASLHILILFGIGFQSLLIGIIGEYLMRTYLAVRGDPIAIIEDSANIDQE
jgi:polyisoprenyl-phosphate glycosyltransferase